MAKNIAVTGGGINGIMTAWELLKQRHSVTLFEKGEVMQQTLSASSKLLHGGLGYLENYEFRLVKEALKERQWWIAQKPTFNPPLPQGEGWGEGEKYAQHGYFLEIPNERRIFFVLPYQGKTLIGTTEQRQRLNDDITPSEQEIDYLINAYNHYFKMPISKKNIVQSFAGLRPVIKSADNLKKATREYAIQQNKKLITVFGGKWTTARQLGKEILI